ncbi:ribonucleoside triphosphate reductase [Candidatus Falkowbacteria bacterium RIFOXYB2_FULL_38_15]|uniref:Ribonucleoside triphosphate reductase n=1 Tax=Candidatus Falkowbacteria bacterium RIFOXYA2_FULL_38_12 TaxID=1797993 RepID=A0A1F5S281_9BACT|nr:MAG: ribonucleoside triphosphate reductase [Candidatus Falkowbacteria bacterium RIFOXYA2_FULL_38_12]OGF32659.1 MAG: ribonucleoside triphosphate reductase [Candidatus Falkowbacteria bacterium RIFOXYB2_FULL_38_15]OGF42063.1 MAG: ribonucleoside triphosphate reductase [Candidatus Falkowbacteria bacterium RIFOXYD2_FULL_39_16]
MYSQNQISQIKKRDGRIVDFDQNKIIIAVQKAMEAVGEKDPKKIQKISDQIAKALNNKFHYRSIPAIEELQDIVEEVLIRSKQIKAAKAYILYRDQHSKIRELKALVDSNQIMGDYLDKLDWLVKENSNMAYSLQGLNNHISSAISSHYWLNKVYPPEIRDVFLDGDIHIHDMQILAAYCCGWDLQDLLVRGFGGVSGKIESKPPNHLRTALGQIVNFFYTLQGEVAGAEAFADFDTYMAPFIRYDKLSYKDVKQAIQEFVFNLNVPTRVGFQTPFTNITMDLNPPSTMAEESVIIGGKPQKEKYKDFQPEMDMINRAFAEVMLEGDAKGRVFSFPIPTYNITPDFEWDKKELDPVWEMTAKYGIPYFANFVNSDMKAEDARSMCCRLRLDNRELRKRGGGLFGANPLTGSIGVVTINMPRIGYLSKTRTEFFERLAKLMDLSRKSLEIKREIIESLTDKGLYPYCRHYLAPIKARFNEYWRNHFNTIGLIGMNEACLNFLGKDITTEGGHDFAKSVLDFMRERLMDYQLETNNLYNLEATPAEGTCYSLIKKDKAKYPDIISANEKAVKENGAVPYYTNSSHLPVDFTNDFIEALKLQDDLQTRYTGGTVLHGFIGERLPSGDAAKKLVRKVAENFKLPYFSLTPTFSVCPKHGYLSGEHKFCPSCDEEIGYKSEIADKQESS